MTLRGLRSFIIAIIIMSAKDLVSKNSGMFSQIGPGGRNVKEIEAKTGVRFV